MRNFKKCYQPRTGLTVIKSEYNPARLLPMYLPFDVIFETVCRVMGENQVMVKSKSRERPLVHCRQLCMYFMRQRTIRSFKDIGRFFNGRDHTTAIHSINAIKKLIFSDPATRVYIDQIQTALGQ